MKEGTYRRYDFTLQMYSDEVLEEFQKMTTFGLAMDAQLTTPHVEREDIPLQPVSLVQWNHIN